MRYSSPQASASPARTWVSTSAISAALISPVAFRRSIYEYAGTLEIISLRLQTAGHPWQQQFDEPSKYLLNFGVIP